MSMNKTSTSTASKPKVGTALSSGKRRLDFDNGARALKNKTFFLDLPGYKSIDQLERELTMRGGKVEKFFNRDVKYLITNHNRDDSHSTPSPLTPSQKGGVAAKSPFESVSSVDSAGTKPVAWGTRGSRAALIVAASQKKAGSKKTVDLVAQAKSWGCKVFSLDTLLQELKKMAPLPHPSSHKSRACGRVHTLNPPFLKVEDQSRGYRPLVHETKEWPCPREDTSPHGCPFDKSRTNKAPVHSKSSRGSPAPYKPHPQEEHQMVTRLKKPGYCECCSVRYNDLRMHLRSGKHLEYANNEANFATLDRLINQGTKFADFVAQLRSKKRSPVKTSPLRRSLRSPVCDTVLLVTPPSPKRSTPVRNMTTPTRQSPVKRLQSPRGRRSPRFHLTQNGMGLRPSPKKTITLQTGTFSSPKTGELKITPLRSPPADLREYTPGFRTPHGAKIEAIARQLTQSSDPARKRERGVSCEGCVGCEDCGGLAKRPRLDNDFVPETPERPVTRSTPGPKKLCNLDSILERVSTTSPNSGGSPSTQGTPPTHQWKGPRLTEKRKRARSVRGTSARPKHLTVSFKLRDLVTRPVTWGATPTRPVTRSATPTRPVTRSATPTIQRPGADGITPEIALQGCSHGTNSKCLNGLPESPLADLVCQRLFESSGSDGPFVGFSPAVAKQALTQLLWGCGPVSSPHSQKNVLRAMSRKSPKRGQSEGGVCVSNVVSPASRRRRVAVRRSPRGHQ